MSTAAWESWKSIKTQRPLDVKPIFVYGPHREKTVSQVDHSSNNMVQLELQNIKNFKLFSLLTGCILGLLSTTLLSSIHLFRQRHFGQQGGRILLPTFIQKSKGGLPQCSGPWPLQADGSPVAGNHQLKQSFRKCVVHIVWTVLWPIVFGNENINILTFMNIWLTW